MTPSDRFVSEPRSLDIQRLYRFPPDIGVGIFARREDVLSYFDAEYGRCAHDRLPQARLEVYVGNYRQAVTSLASQVSRWLVYERRHKLAKWRMALSGLDEETTRLAFEGRGVMLLPYLQNFYVEPLLRIKSLQAGYALVHGSSVMKGTKSVLFPAESRVGKTMLTLRQVIRGKAIQGDNCVIVSPKGDTFAFPRRLRIYSDLRRADPIAYGRLPRREKIRLTIAGSIRSLSFGYANPASRLGLEVFVPNCTICPHAQLDSIFVLTPHEGPDLVGPIRLGLEQLVESVQAHSFSEGRWLMEAVSPCLTAELESWLLRKMDVERQILAAAFEGVPAFELLVPRVTDPGPLLSRMARISGINAEWSGEPERCQ